MTTFATTLSQLLDAPRVTAISIAAGRLVTTVQQLKQDGTGYVNQLWDVTDTPTQLTYADDSVSAVEQADTERSEEHTSELQSRGHLVCRLLLEKKKKKNKNNKYNKSNKKTE